MKIMVCGKGGCGKSTVSALLAFSLVRKGKRVLVADLDESNFGLHRQLGLSLPKDLTLFFGSKKGIYQAIDGSEKKRTDVPEKAPHTGRPAFGGPLRLEALPGEFVSGKPPLQLVAIGKIHEAGEGCACAMGTLAKEFLKSLALAEDEIVIADAEAGVEHFGRGVDAAADAVLMVLDPSYESICLSEKVAEMCEELEKPLFFLINRAAPEDADMIREKLERLPGRLIGRIPDDPRIRRAGLAGDSLAGLAPDEIEYAEEVLFCEEDRTNER